jgi:hypothetical protein
MIWVESFVRIDRGQNLLVFRKFKYLTLDHRGRCATHYGSGILSEVIESAPNGS